MSIDGLIKILFLTANPSNTARLRLGTELRKIHERLRLSRERDQFVLESRDAVRPGDITQAIFDVTPNIVHFSGHGTTHGELCFESEIGTVQTVPINALSRIFSLVADQVKCVLLNACYTDEQARAIAQYIKFVIGMSNSIGDEAAITFSTGFYKALGANHSIEKAYHFGCAEIELQNIPEHLTPVLYANSEKKTRVKFTFTLKGTLSDLDDEKLQTILQYLQRLSGDVSLTLHKIEEGSIKITFKGSEEAFKRIEYLFNEGEISDIFDLPIQDLKSEIVDLQVENLKHKKSLTTAMARNNMRRNLRNQNFSGQDLRGKNFFSGADLREANFQHANLQGVDFSGAELQEANFQHANLREADFTNVSGEDINFSSAKIQGTNFTDAVLIRTNFTGAQAGLHRSRLFGLVFVSLILCLSSAFSASIIGTFSTYFFRIFRQKFSLLISLLIGFLSVIFTVTLRTLLIKFNQLDWINTHIWIGIFLILVVAFCALIAVTNDESNEDLSSIILTVAFLICSLVLTMNKEIKWINLTPLESRLFSVFPFLSLKEWIGAGAENTSTWLVGAIGAIIGAFFGCWFSLTAIAEDNKRFSWLWKWYLQFANSGGTLFINANLTNAIFISATLKGANFKNANIGGICWRGVKFLQHAYVGNSYLKYLNIRQLVLGRRVKNKNFDNLNLEGINLEAADLSDASFIGTNLNYANLRDANLTRANLKQAKLDGADLTQADLTGAIIENWIIDTETIFDEIKCEFVFQEADLNPTSGMRRRLPPFPKNFEPGDFERLFKKDSATIQLLIRNDDNQQAITAAFKQLTQDTEYTFQGFEMIGDDGLVKIRVPRNTDTSAVENKFYTYQKQAEQSRQENLQNPEDSGDNGKQSLVIYFLQNFSIGTTMSSNREIVMRGNGNYIESNSGTYVQRDYIINMSQDLAQAASQIQDLLDQLKQNGVTVDVAQEQIAKDIATEAQENQTMKEKLVKWGESLASATVSDVVKGIIRLACNSAGIPL